MGICAAGSSEHTCAVPSKCTAAQLRRVEKEEPRSGNIQPREHVNSVKLVHKDDEERKRNYNCRK